LGLRTSPPGKRTNVLVRASAYRGGYYGGGYGYGYRRGYYGAAQAGTAAGQLTCRDAAKLQYPNERQMRKAFKKECKLTKPAEPQ
jgi:hypothetical protein